MIYLVTGAPGWLGTRFVRALSGAISELKDLTPVNDTDEIRCLVQPNMNASILESIHPKVKTYLGDVTDLYSLKEFFSECEGGVVFHLAGVIHPTQGIKQIFHINVNGSKNILDSAIRNKLRRMIAVSSNSPSGTNSNNGHLFTEESTYKPYLAYGRSKMQMEILINDAFQKDAIETVIHRPCWFYGPEQPERQTKFFSMIKNGRAPIVGGGLNKRSMSYVDNICQALLLATNSEKANGETYWVADERPYTMNEIVDTLERLLENEFGFEVAHKRLKLPNIASAVAYGVDWTLQKFGLYHQKIHVLSEMNKSIACSIVKAQNELGYEPKISLEEGMRRSIQWCLDNGHVI